MNLITEHLDTWTATVHTKSSAGRGGGKKRELYGIKKLRELILELAVRGLLVPQDPNDSPAVELLKQIEAKQAELIKHGKLKKPKKLPAVSEDEIPFQIPDSWKWCRLLQLANPQAGFAFKSKDFNESEVGLPLIRIRDVGQQFSGTYFSGDYREEFIVEHGDYLISMDGIFRVAAWELQEALLNQRVTRLQFYDDSVPQDLIAKALQIELSKLQGVKAYTTVDHLSGKQISNAIIPLPPLAEQHRIVAKVDELMGLCDRLEQQQSDHMATHELLVNTLLDALVAAASDAEHWTAAWQRIAENFNALFTTEASIDQLKQTILQLAVMSKLVEQDANDEPARELLKKIATEKDKLVKEKKIKKQKKLPEITEEEAPFILPAESWSWVKLDDITELITKGSSPKWQGISYVTKEEGILFVTSENVGYYNLRKLDEPKYVESRFNEIEPRSILNRGDILMNLVGASIGRTALYALDEEANINQAVALIRLVGKIDGVDRNYLLHYLNSPEAIDYMLGSRVINAQPNISLTDARNFLIPLPPLAEQHRIVAKVDELMALCDALKAKLQAAQATQLNLADSLVEKAVG